MHKTDELKHGTQSERIKTQYMKRTNWNTMHKEYELKHNT